MVHTVRLSAPEPFDWKVDRAPLDLPEELQLTLDVNPKARQDFGAWSLMQQWDVAWFIEEAVDEHTRKRRADKAIGVLERRLALLGT
jgi:uncharacterized protein YdeI (YjbR/CyaY-like superfamily)